MTLPSPNLDDLRFQEDLVDEARKRIVRYCPEWTEYNVSDPGITLIELFSWMTELLAFRLNKVPEKNYISFLNLLGFQRQPASSARTEQTFWLSIPLPISEDNLQDVIIPSGLEMRTDSGEAEEVIFSTDRDLCITPPILTQILKEGQLNRNYLSRLGIEIFYPFNQHNPRPGDMFYLGFDAEKDISGHILQLNFSCEPTEAVGIRREDPPWVWECSLGNDQWHEVAPSVYTGEKDTTGGLNNPEGQMVLYLPLGLAPDQVYGRQAYWVRCRLEQRDPSQGMYTESPRVTSINANVLGASVPASHAQVILQEYLGNSSGEPGLEFSLENAPVLELKEEEAETLLVEEFRNGEYVLVPWKLVKDFSDSTRYDRHYTLDSASGLVQLGPGIRQSDGTTKQYGRIPENGRMLYFKRYRFGGGARGNLPPNTIQTMTSSIAYVARVSNLVRSSGGQDQEDLEEVKLRAQRELQAQNRAVTAQDYEQFVRGYSRSVARVKCLAPEATEAGDNEGRETGVVQILVDPAVATALETGDLSRLHLNPEFVSDLSSYLDQYRLLTTIVKVSDPNYIGVKLNIEIVISDYSNPQVVMERVNRVVRNMINPLVPFPDLQKEFPLLEAGWDGWPLGRSLYPAEIYALVQRIPGVQYVLDVGVSYRTVNPSVEGTPNAPVAPLAELEDKVLWVAQDTLLCSLDHEVSYQTLTEFESQKQIQAK